MRSIYAGLLACSLLSAAEHRGQVRFAGLPVPGVTVTATRNGVRAATITGADGLYSFPNLEDGVWTVRLEMLCFAALEREIAIVPEAPAAEWELKLLPAGEIMASAVSAPPPASTTAPAAAASSAPAFQHAEANAAPGAAPENGSDPAAPAEMDSDGFLINGSVHNGSSTPFAQAAAFGNFRRKPGSLYNASLGLIFDTSAWDARSFSLTGQNTPKPDYRRMTGMASFGGPVKIPRLSMRDGINLTVNYQWTRNRNASTQTARVPTELERGGDFSRSVDAAGRPVRLVDPATSMPIPGAMLPAGRISPQARALLDFYPLPNHEAGAQYNFQLPLVGSTHQDSLQSRGSKTVGRKNQVSGSFAMQSLRSDSTSLFGFLDTTRSLGSMTSANWMHRLGLRTFSNLGFQFSRQSSTVTPFFAGRLDVSGRAGIAGNDRNPANWGPPSLQFSGGTAALTDAQSSASHNQTAQLSASLLRSSGPHNITFGGDLWRQQLNQLAQQDPRGAFTFTGAAAGSDLAGFLLGIPDTSSIAFGNADKYFRASSLAAYANDDYRAGPTLTVNGGLRWEYSSPIAERYGRLVNLDIGPAFSTVAPVLASSPVGSLTGDRYPDSLLRPFRRALQPRVGVSWRPLLASSMVVRAGYGVYYDTSVYTPVAGRMAQQPPFSKTLSVANGASTPLTLADGFRAPLNAASNTMAVDPDFRPGYAQNWQLSVQRDLPAALVVTATYLGSKGTRAQQQFLPQTFPAGAASPCPACPSGYAYLASGGNSTRESGQLQLRRRLHSGVAAQFSYTFAKAIDDAALGGRGQSAAVIAQDWLNLAGERGRSAFDQRHLVDAQVQYTTGMGLGGGTLLDGWRGRLTKDWTASAKIIAGTGLPLTPVYLAAVRGTGVTGSIRPDYTGAPLYDGEPGRYLNPAAVAAPAPARWGNAGRNSITGPAQLSLNASLSRTFRLSDRTSFDFRLESANVLNHVTFTRWDVTATSAQFGLPVAANQMRNLQVVLRARF